MRRLAAKVMGKMATPAIRAALMAPMPARMCGPRGPSGVMPAVAPEARVLSTARSASVPPREVDPVMAPTPKCLIVSAMKRPSGCREIRMLTGGASGFRQ